MIKPKSGMGTTVRCPRCKYENLAIDIWCARCGTPVDWKGLQAASETTGNGKRLSTAKGNGHASGLAGLAGLAAALPWARAKVPHREPSVTPAAAAPVPEAIRATEAPEELTPTPIAAPTRVFCLGCGQANDPANKFCPRCGYAVAAAKPAALAAVASRIVPARSWRMPTQMRMPQVRLPRIDFPRVRLPRIPMVAWAVAAAVVVLLIVPLAYVLSASGRHFVASPSQPHATLAKTGPPVAGQGTALSAAIPGVEAKTGLKYTTGSCAPNSPCLRLASQSNGLNAAAVQFSTAGTGGRQCVGYVYKNAAAWHFLDATCGLPGQLSPLVGNSATVHVPGQCANVRDAAGLQGKIVVCLNDGTLVRVDGGPNYADGKIWWHLEKKGWMAHDFLVTA